MALLINITCLTCGKESQECIGAGLPAPNICSECRQAEEDLKRRIHLHGLEVLTLTERIRKLEEWAYDYKPPMSIHDMKF